MSFEIRGGHEESSIVFIDESNCLGIRWIGCPERIRVIISTGPLTTSPRVSNLEYFHPVAQSIRCNECVGMTSDDAIFVYLSATGHNVMFLVPIHSRGPEFISSFLTGINCITSSPHKSVAGINHPATFYGLVVAMKLTKSFFNENRPELFCSVDIGENMVCIIIVGLCG